MSMEPKKCTNGSYKFNFLLDDGFKYGTFDKKIAEESAGFLEKGVRIGYEVDGAFRNLKQITVM